MAGQVVESMAGDFNPEQYTDTYQEQLQVLVESKLAGGQAFATAEAPARIDDTDDVSDLLAKLEASVRRRREQSAGAAPAQPAGKAPARKAPAKPAVAKKAVPAKAVVKKAVAKKAVAAKAPVKKAPARKVAARK
jgi:DNA end-binding protein Ku